MPNVANRREIEQRITSLEEEIAKHKAITNQPPNATVAPGGLVTTPAEPPPAAEPKHETPLVTAAPSPPTERKPIYKKWWLWTTVGVVAVGVGLGVGLGLGLAPSGPPSSEQG